MISRCLGLWVKINLTAQTVHGLNKNCRGVAAPEYPLIAALIAVAAIASFTLLGTRLSSTFSSVAIKL
jgi:pilus assembly protein Flp/PilA